MFGPFPLKALAIPSTAIGPICAWSRIETILSFMYPSRFLLQRILRGVTQAAQSANIRMNFRMLFSFSPFR
jgi:hypothetical protein